MRRLLLAVCLAALVVVPTASAGNDPESLVLSVVKWNLQAQYGKVWRSLHPRYRAVTTRMLWEACQRKKATERAGVEFLSVKVTETYPDAITLPLLGRIRVEAVSVAAKVEYLGQTSTVRDTLYVTKLNGTWFGLWTPEQYRGYKAKRCPA